MAAEPQSIRCPTRRAAAQQLFELEILKQRQIVGILQNNCLAQSRPRNRDLDDLLAKATLAGISATTITSTLARVNRRKFMLRSCCSSPKL